MEVFQRENMVLLHLEIAVIGILHGIESGFFSRLAEVSFAAGLQAIEVSMNTVGGLQMVEGNIFHVPEEKYWVWVRSVTGRMLKMP